MKDYSVKETSALFIYAYNEMYKNNEEITLRGVIKKIVIIIKEEKINSILETIDINILNKIPFLWKLSIQEVIAYAIAIFYILIIEKEKITEEKIINELLNELYARKPVKTLKKADLIARQAFPELSDELD